MHFAPKPCALGRIAVVLFALGGCATSSQLISATSIEAKIAALRMGQSTKTDVENVLGSDHSVDSNRWAYNFSDAAFDVSERKQGPGLGILPLSAGIAPTNTRAVVTVAFNDAGVMTRLAVARYFAAPFINDYWFEIKDASKQSLQSIAKMGETAGMKAVDLDSEAGTLTLADQSSEAKITVKLEGTTLRLTSRNPNDRLGSEYRVYTKRESALTDQIANSNIVQ